VFVKSHHYHAQTWHFPQFSLLIGGQSCVARHLFTQMTSVDSLFFRAEIASINLSKTIINQPYELMVYSANMMTWEWFMSFLPTLQGSNNKT
jgi:hypothetical protein